MIKKTNNAIGAERQFKIINFIGRWQYATQKTLALNLKIPQEAISKNLKSLISQKLIIQKTDDTFSQKFYVLTDFGKSERIAKISENVEKYPILQADLERAEQDYKAKAQEINPILIKHNISLQEFLPQILQILEENNVENPNFYLTEREQSVALRNKINSKIYDLVIDVEVAKNQNQDTTPHRQKLTAERQKLKSLKAKYADLLVNRVAVEFERTLKKDKDLDQMLLHYATNNNIKQVFIFSKSSLNPYHNAIQGKIRNWVYNPTERRFKPVENIYLTPEQKSKFKLIKLGAKNV